MHIVYVTHTCLHTPIVVRYVCVSLLTHWDADLGVRVFPVGCWWCTIRSTRFYLPYNNDTDSLGTSKAHWQPATRHHSSIKKRG
jgi:hypothetical protein